MRASFAEQLQQWAKANSITPSLPASMLTPLPTCSVHLYVKHLGLSKDKREAYIMRDRNTVLVTKLSAPRWKEAKVNKDALAVKHFTPDGFMFVQMPAIEATYLM